MIPSHMIPRDPETSTEIRIGAHVSIVGGLAHAVRRAHGLGCETLQIFSKSPRGWAAGPVDRADADLAFTLRQAWDLSPFAVHACYLINLASPDLALYERSVTALGEELLRCALMHADCLVVHVGCVREGQRDGLQRVSTAIRRALDRSASAASPLLLLENTAGERGDVGSRFEELAEILWRVDDPRVAVCLDTCHTLAAGYDIRTPAAVAGLVQAIQSSIGIPSIKLIHANDSKRELGSRVDRHEHIGEGAIGGGGFRAFLSRPELRGIPLVLETPKRSDRDDADDKRNLRRLRQLARPRPTAPVTPQRCRRSSASERASTR
jgi:deoxyribonuclease-4